MFWPAFNFARDVWYQDTLARSVIDNSFKQCRKPIRLINRAHGFDRNGKARSYIEVPLHKGHYVLPSGFSGTTNMNNNSQTIFFACVHHRLTLVRDRLVMADVKGLLMEAARDGGFQIKVDVCERLEDFQFLKHSWGKDSCGVYKPYVNMGCWLRNYGQISGHVQGRKGLSMHDRLMGYTADIVRSRVHWGDCAITDVFRERFLDVQGGLSDHLLRDERLRSGILGCRIMDHSIMRRYRLTAGEYGHFVETLRGNLEFGIHINHPVIAKIMMKDYGYGPERISPHESVKPKFVVLDGKERQTFDLQG
jgi:hypothetical protein